MRGNNPKLTFNIRSPISILYYLGEVVRRHLYPEFGFDKRNIEITIGPSDRLVPEGGCGGTTSEVSVISSAGFRCESLFDVDLGPNKSSVSVEYNGQVYWLHDERGGGQSLQVLDLVKQIFALNSSTKQTPAASALSVIVSP